MSNIIRFNKQNNSSSFFDLNLKNYAVKQKWTRLVAFLLVFETSELLKFPKIISFVKYYIKKSIRFNKQNNSSSFLDLNLKNYAVKQKYGVKHFLGTYYI